MGVSKLDSGGPVYSGPVPRQAGGDRFKHYIDQVDNRWSPDPGRMAVPGIVDCYLCIFINSPWSDLPTASQASLGKYQAFLEDISLRLFLVAGSGYAMLDWSVSGLELAAEAAVGKS
jgi:hypothetical protein